MLERIRERRRSEGLAGQTEFSHIGLEQFQGIDVNGFAVEIAKVTLQLGKKLASDELATFDNVLPLDNLAKSIRKADALFTRWPDADAIIGNPPFIGRGKMLNELGSTYCRQLDEKFGPKGLSDFVTYWIPLAHDALPEGGRAGFVTTKSVKHGDGRKASLDYVVDNGGVIFNAIPSVPWSGTAVVEVAIVNWQKGGAVPKTRKLWIDPHAAPLVVDEIPASLSTNIDLRTAQPLAANRGKVFQGVTAGNMKAFRVSTSDAEAWLDKSAKTSEVLHPFIGGKKMLHQFRTETWLVDVAYSDAGDAWNRHPVVMAHLEETALPDARERAAKEPGTGPRTKYLETWWMPWRRRPAMVEALDGLDRFIALSRVAADGRLPVFSFVDGNIRVDDSTVAFPFDDDYSLGILQSNLHEQWFRARCSSMRVDPRYTSTTVFDAFPWPQFPDTQAAQAVADAAASIIDERATQFGNGISLAAQYDVLRKPGQSRLRALHSELNKAVMALYGFDPDEDHLAQLLSLNLSVSASERQGEAVTSPGMPDGVASHSTWSFPAA